MQKQEHNDVCGRLLGLRLKRGRGVGLARMRDDAMQRCEQAPPLPNSIPGGLPFSPPPLFLSSRHYDGGTARHDMTSYPSLFSVLRTHERIHTRHTYTRAEPNTPPPPPSPLLPQTPSLLARTFSPTQTQKRTYYMPVCPALPPPDTTTGYGRSAFIARRSRYFAGAVGGGIQYSIRSGGICALRLPWWEREKRIPQPTNQPTPHHPPFRRLRCKSGEGGGRSAPLWP